MDTIGEDGTGSKENCRQAEGTSWEKQIQPFCSSLEKLPPSPRKEDVRSHDEGHVSKGGGFRVSVTGSRWLGYSKIGEICAIHKSKWI